MIPWRGKSVFRTYNPNKIIKYGLLVRALCESASGYILNIEIYSAKGTPLETTILNLLKPYFDNFYNSLKIAEKLLEKKIHLCGIIRKNRGLPKDFNQKCASLKTDETEYIRKGSIFLFGWHDKRLVNMVSTIHNSEFLEKINRRGISKSVPICISDYNKFMKGVDQFDQYLSYYSLLRKTLKWTKKVALWLINSGLINSFIIYKKVNKSSNIKFKDYLIDVAKILISENKNESLSYIQDEQSKRPLRSPHNDPSYRTDGNMRNHEIIKIDGRRRCKVCLKNNKRKETSFMC